MKIMDPIVILHILTPVIIVVSGYILDVYFAPDVYVIEDCVEEHSDDTAARDLCWEEMGGEIVYVN